MPDSNYSSKLLLSAAAYSALGYSVIPLLGDAAPDHPKAPAVPWAAYQSRRATESDFLRWFRHERFQGIGIITGRISNLMVLDFDNPDLYHEFCAQHPDLAEVHVIQTRRGFHIYYQLPAYLTVQTRKGQGVDLLANGCYVVARPTTIADFSYMPVTGGQPKILTQLHLNRINAFLDAHSPSVRYEGNEAREKVHIPSIVSASGDTLFDPQALYRAQIGQGAGRNQSLFFTALVARDHGWSQNAVQAELVDLHARTQSASHPNETTAQRQHEALNTIRSAFSKPARPVRSIRTISPQMPTRLREKLYALKLTCFVRTIEGLREKGIQPGQVFTRKQAVAFLRGWVGRNSIDNALAALAPGGETLITREALPPLEPHRASNDAADEINPTELKNCVSEGTTNQGKIVVGRKPRYYIMPSNSQLIYRLGIKYSSSDPIQLDDLASASKTRQASHRELIRRRPGQYYRRWLAERLGVSSRTTQRYDTELHIRVQPMFHQQPITWDTLNAIPDEPVPSMFLMDERHRRYPADRKIAIQLLSRVAALYLMRQEANFYSIDAPEIALAQVWKYRRAQQEQIEQRLTVEQGRAASIPSTPLHPAAQPRSGLPPPDEAVSPPRQQEQPGQRLKTGKPAIKLTKRRARQPLPDARQEVLVQRAYRLINARTSDPTRRISQATLRYCVSTYGANAVENALKQLLKRRNLTNPAGFFLTIARSESKAVQKGV